jgi:hypothetical protein
METTHRERTGMAQHTEEHDLDERFNYRTGQRMPTDEERLAGLVAAFNNRGNTIPRHTLADLQERGLVTTDRRARLTADGVAELQTHGDSTDASPATRRAING